MKKVFAFILFLFIFTVGYLISPQSVDADVTDDPSHINQNHFSCIGDGVGGCDVNLSYGYTCLGGYGHENYCDDFDGASDPQACNREINIGCILIYEDAAFRYVMGVGCQVCEVGDDNCVWDTLDKCLEYASGQEPDSAYSCESTGCETSECDPELDSNCFYTATDCNYSNCDVDGSNLEIPEENYVVNRTCGNIPDTALAQKCRDCMGGHSKDDEASGGKVWTALGCISTKPTGFIAQVLQIAIGLGGGIAFLMLIYGAFLMTTSAGDPKAVENARGVITGAISGLLLIIFSVVILNFIGVQILQIPGL